MAEFGKWTSAIEDPPKEDGYYLIFGTFTFIPDHIDDPNERDAIDMSFYSTQYGWLGSEIVKYWMELPAPPKEGGDV